MDIVFPLANKSRFRNDFELRYSLRSWDRQGWIDNVFIVGDHLPAWLRGVFHIPCPDPYKISKDANIINKLIRACCVRSKLEFEFIVNSDDQYVLRPITPGDLRATLENPPRLGDYKSKYSSNSWNRRVIDSIELLKKMGRPDWIFEAHKPYVINRSYPADMAEIPWGNGNGLITHAWFNLTLEEEPEREPAFRTIRVKQPLSRKILSQALGQATFLNHNDDGLNDHLMAFLQDRFPEPSRWEKLK